MYGIYLQDSNGNDIYTNNFINNNNNVNSSYSINNWNSTGPITYQYNGSTFINYVGNYWSDYTGSDSDSDGIGDTPYEINDSAGLQDEYPLIEPLEGVDLVHPYVTITFPANLATNVKIDTEITATFSEPMNSSTLNNSTVKVYSLDEIVGETFENTNGSWNSSNFQAFNHSEELTVWQTPIDNTHRTIGEHNLTYSTHSLLRDYQLYSNEGIEVEYSGNYSVIGWLGDENVVINSGTGDWIISKLVFEQNSTDTKTLHVGETWDLGDGYSFKLVELDVDGNKAWMALNNSNGKIDDEVCQNQSAYIFSTDLGASDNTPIFVTYLNKVNLVQSHIELKYTWLISQETSEIQNNEQLGDFRVKTFTDRIIIENDEDMFLMRDSTIPLFYDFKFEVEDTSTVQYSLIYQYHTDTSVDGDISYDNASRTITFDPVSDLICDTNYISYITTGAEDLAGNGLVEDYFWTFETTNYTAVDIPQITDFKVEPNTSVSINNPAIASAYITDKDLNSVYFELFDSNGLIDTNNIMLWWYLNESGINGNYSTHLWYANAWSVTNDTIQDVVTIGYPANCPNNGILFGIFKKNNTADAEEALLRFNLTTGNLTNITLDDIDRTPLSIETGVSIFRIFNLKLAIIPFVEGSTFTLYTIGDLNNPHIVSIPVPTGAYQALVTANDTAGNVNVLWADIEVDNTPPNITITSPANNSIVYTPTITVFGSVTDNMGIMCASFFHECVIGGGEGEGAAAPFSRRIFRLIKQWYCGKDGTG